MRTEKLPLLPRAAVDEHNLQGGRLLYTPAQMRAYGLACYQQGLEDAAKVCDDLASGHQFVHDSRAESSTDECADAIRRLKDTL